MIKQVLFPRIIYSFTFCCGAFLSVNAQVATSPFDLIPRMEGEVIADSSTFDNPFDIVDAPVSWRPSSSPGFSVEKQEKPLTSKEKTSIYRRFLFFAILSMFILLTLLVTIFRVLLNKIWKAFINDNLLHQLQREQIVGYNVAYVLFYLMFLMNAGIFLFLTCQQLGVALGGSNIVSLMICVGGLAGFYLIKHFLLQVVKFVFPVEKEISSYNFTIIIFNIVIGFFLVPIILFMAYAPEQVAAKLLYVAMGLLALTFMFRSLRGLFIANRFLAWHKFHFLLYLCAVELAPILIVTKLLLLQKGA